MDASTPVRKLSPNPPGPKKRPVQLKNLWRNNPKFMREVPQENLQANT
jgi:hypothetical protein